MIKNNKRNNALIKQKNLVLAIKKAGIKRVSPPALSLLSSSMKKNLEELLKALKEEMIIQGRKTLKRSDVKRILIKLKKQKDSWEV